MPFEHKALILIFCESRVGVFLLRGGAEQKEIFSGWGGARRGNGKILGAGQGNR